MTSYSSFYGPLSLMEFQDFRLDARLDGCPPALQTWVCRPYHSSSERPHSFAHASQSCTGASNWFHALRQSCDRTPRSVAYLHGWSQAPKCSAVVTKTGTARSLRHRPPYQHASPAPSELALILAAQISKPQPMRIAMNRDVVEVLLQYGRLTML